MINRAGNKEKAKRVLNENGNLSGMVGMEILYRVIAAITSVLLGAMIAGGIGVVSAVVSAPFKLFGLAGIIIAYRAAAYLPGRDALSISKCGFCRSGQYWHTRRSGSAHGQAAFRRTHHLPCHRAN